MAGSSAISAGENENPAARSPAPRVVAKSLNDRARVEMDGALWTEYIFKGAAKPYCYPLLGPAGMPLTRNWPMQNFPGEAHDHPHQRSFWFGHGSVNGVDFWAETPGAGQIKQTGLRLENHGDWAVIQTQNRWEGPEGQAVCTDERRLTFHAPDTSGARIFDFEITLRAPHAVIFGDTKEGTMAIRVTESMRLKGGLGEGKILLSSGVAGTRAWGKRAEWCDYSGPVNGQIAGIAIFDHPGNLRHPTWWHVRDYGLFAANPFGWHDFETAGTAPRAGDFTLAPGQTLTLRYRFYLHAGSPDRQTLARQYEAFARIKSASRPRR